MSSELPALCWLVGWTPDVDALLGRGVGAHGVSALLRAVVPAAVDLDTALREGEAILCGAASMVMRLRALG